ncbi:MAG: methyltransferase domain-containing protein [Anaerolineae bacterium]|nr:methyltransferase domain-containing protein [Anaerolineae bacterium]
MNASGDRLENYRQRYAACKPGWEPATARYQRRVARLLTPTAHVLDLGCGRGGIAERLSGFGQWMGLDPDHVSLREHRLPDLLRAQADALRLPLGSATFDLVVSSWVMEHLSDPPRVFDEVARVLRPGGRLICLTPNARHPIPRLGQILAHWQRTLVPKVYGRGVADAFPVYYRANTPEQLSRLGAQAGLRLVNIELVEDPSYFSWNRSTFALAARLEILLPALWKVHLIAEFTHH